MLNEVSTGQINYKAGVDVIIADDGPRGGQSGDILAENVRQRTCGWNYLRRVELFGNVQLGERIGGCWREATKTDVDAFEAPVFD